ncbi:MAG: ATP-binding protein [Rhodocyclaceae bacterium]|nr:ATP-binding protein [Rhodocyclaceae bacterium]MDZ4214021.1 ATP-binding protein [Rhodocyclaceae bacterium]
MTTQTDFNNAIEDLSEIWCNPAARNGRFGNILKCIAVRSIRGINADVEFSWPVTAIAGTNGSGKTTILQLCSAAYVSAQGGRNYKIGEWVRNALKDETAAFGEDSSVSFSFWNDCPVVPIPYRKDRTRWDYPRRNNPERFVQFFGISTFAPRIERKDRLHVFRSQIELKASAPFDANLITSMSKVLGITYDSGVMQTVGLEKGSWNDVLPLVKRGVLGYSEPHMGAGEQKIIRLMRALEALPERSLVLIEEPEITLHPDAQRGLAWYFMNLAKRKGHQIILTTHSAELFEALPGSARILLARRKTGVDVVPNIPSIQAARELSSVVKSNNDLILVEDSVAKLFLIDILERFDRPLLHHTSIVPVGNTHDVYRMVQSFRGEGVRAVGVRDADIGNAAGDHVFSLPGDLAPEELLLSDENIAQAEGLMHGIGDAFGRAKIAGIDHTGSKWAKKVFPALASEMGIDVEKLRDRLTLAWLNQNGEAAAKLVDDIKLAFI